MANQFNPDDEARINAYWGAPAAPAHAPGSLEATIAAANGGQAAPTKPAHDAPPPPPMGGALGIDSSWLGGAQAPALPPVSASKPGDLFATKAAPSIPPVTAPVQPKPQAPDRPLLTPKQQAEMDREFDAYVASLKKKPSSPRTPAASGSAGARPANPDPYGINAAQRAEVDSYDDRKRAVERAAVAEQDRTVMRAEHLATLERMREEDAAIARAESDFAERSYTESMSELQRQLDDVKARKVDPLRQIKESPALGVMAVIGGVVSGFYQGFTGGQKNQFMEDFNRQIDRGIAEDEREIRDERSAIGEKVNMLHQLRSSQKDKQLAEMQYRNLAYESAKAQIDAEAERAGTDVARARADETKAQISGAQAKLQQEIGARKQAQAQSAASQAHQRQKEVQAAYKDIYEKVLAAGHSPSVAEAEARRAVGVIYLGNAGPRDPSSSAKDPLASVPKEARGKAAEEVQAHATAEKSIGAVNNAFEQLKNLPVTAGPWDRDRDALKANILASYKAGLGPGMSSDQDAERFLEPLIPNYTDSAATVERKRALIEQSIRSKVATPLLDQYSPGWRPPSQNEADVLLGAKPVR